MGWIVLFLVMGFIIKMQLRRDRQERLAQRDTRRDEKLEQAKADVTWRG